VWRRWRFLSIDAPQLHLAPEVANDSSDNVIIVVALLRVRDASDCIPRSLASLIHLQYTALYEFAVIN